MTHRGSRTEKRRRQEGEEVGGGEGGKYGGSITVALVSECEATLPSTAADTADGHVSKRVVMIPLGEPPRDVPLPLDPLSEERPSW